MSNFILPLLLVLFAGFMFMTARRQRRQAQETQQMQSSLVPGDRVMTTSGLYATIVETDDDTIELEVAPGVRTTWVRQAVREKIKSEIGTSDDVDVDVDDVVEGGPKADSR
jgi:preprotein translocase subunit YajC